MKTGRALLALGLLAMGAPSRAAEPTAEAKKPGVSVTGIELKLFDRQKNALVSPDASSDPYGMNVDAVLIVHVQGTWEKDAPLLLKLEARAPKESSEATGERPGWKVAQSRKLTVLSESGSTSVPFLLPFQCASQVQVTATLTGPGVKGGKTLATSFACAE